MRLEGCTPWPADAARRYRAAGYWRGQTLGGLLREAAARHGPRTAVVAGDRRVSYAQLDVRADRLAAGLAGLGLGAGDRAVVQLPNVPEFFAVAFALSRLGAVPVLASPSHRRREIRHFAEVTGAVAYVIPDRHAGVDHCALAREITAMVPHLQHVLVVGVGGAGPYTALAEVGAEAVQLAEPEPGEVALLQPSGGGAGLPTLVPRTHDDYLYSVRASAEICGIDESTVYLCALPVAHSLPLGSPGALGTLYAGGTVVLAPAACPEAAFPLIARERVTVAALAPPLALAWLDAAAGGAVPAPAAVPDAPVAPDLSSLKLLQVGGARLPVEAARRVRPVLGCRLQQVFGVAEGLVSCTRDDDPEEIVTGTQGRPVSPDDELRIVDERGRDLPVGETGELLARGPSTVRGYYRAPEHDAVAFTADGFYRTGDLARLTPTGHLVVEGRVDDRSDRRGRTTTRAAAPG